MTNIHDSYAAARLLHASMLSANPVLAPHKPRATERSVRPRLHFLDCAVDTDAHTLVVCGQERHLEPRGFALLVYLIQHRHRVVSKAELLDALWPTRHVTENVVARCVMKVRIVLADRRDSAAIIKTIHRVGYRFDADVRCCNRPDEANQISDILTLRQLYNGGSSLAQTPLE